MTASTGTRTLTTPTGTAAEVADAEPADPHHPPPGCRFHPRCPIGPLVFPDRTVCRDTEPVAAGHRHGAACHFACDAAMAGAGAVARATLDPDPPSTPSDEEQR